MLCLFSIFDYLRWYHLILDSMVYIETPHLLLRDWEEEDILPFVRMNSDKEVMEFFLTTLTEEETMAFIVVSGKNLKNMVMVCML